MSENFRNLEVPVTGIYNRDRWKAKVEYPEEVAEEVKLPGKGRQAVNFARAVGRSAVRFISGKGWYATPEVAAARHLVCRTRCQMKGNPGKSYYRASDDRCAHPKCGCNLSSDGMVSKTTWAHAKCPEGYWEKHVTEILKQGGG